MPLLKIFYRAFVFTLFISKTYGQESKFPVLADELKLIETQLLKAQELSIKLRDANIVNFFQKTSLQGKLHNLASKELT